MTTSREKFLGAEEKASQLVEHLSKLKEEATNYHDAEKSLSETQETLSNLINQIEPFIEEQRSLIDTLQEISSEEIIDPIVSSQESVNKMLYGIQGNIEGYIILSKQIQRLVYIAIGLIIVVGVLILIS